MKITYTDEQLQAAIDGACEATSSAGSHHCLDLRPAYSYWKNERYARLSLAKALLAALPEPANAELDAFRSFFGRASVILRSIDGGGDNGTTDEFLDRLALIPRLETTPEEREAIDGLRVSQGLTGAQVLRQALRHYQMAVQGKPEPSEIPWTEWNGGECPLSDEAVEEWEEMRTDGEPSRWSFPPSYASGWSLEVQYPISRYRVRKWRNGYGPSAESKPAYVGDMAHDMHTDRTRRPLPTPPNIIPLDINDIRATDEFRPCGEVYQICTWRHADEERISLFSCGSSSHLTYQDLAANYLRRQHGSNEWKPCTKEA